MEQSNRKPGAGGPKLMYIVVGVLMAAIIVLAALMMVFKAQADDYRDSKFKMQCALVTDAIDTISTAGDAIDQMLDDDLDNGWRRSAALSAEATVRETSDLIYSISVAFSPGDNRTLTFQNLSDAFSMFADTVYAGYEELSTSDIPQGERDVSATVEASIIVSASIAENISVLLQAGMQPGVDWLVDPYLPLDGMDMGALWIAAKSMMAAQ